ncbi:hypothetical protein F8M41_021773 [Gigaspora margarita]|uniref:RING-type domain-containing protein n=1 Tax=Gigaspora margarita TaxID=4874 RepID=A0A8H4ETL2_GIGMA|nr:hypothetical protein F8M41_021773 [Gigaspora margarita]
MTTNISCLETFALNILKNLSPNKIASNVNVTELDPCTLCNQELFLICGHIFHRNCIESSIKISSKCPKQNCKKEIESVVDIMPGSQDLDLMIMSPTTFKSPIITQKSDISKKCTGDYLLFPNKLSNKKTKHVKKELLTLKKLLKELSTEPTHAETQNEIINQEVITTYYLFGKALIDRYEYYKTNNPKHTAQALVNKEISEQLPTTISNTLLRKRKERAQKIYNLFSEIGENKIQHIKSISALSISKLSQDEIDTILVHFSQK